MARALVQVDGAAQLRRSLKKAGVDLSDLATENQRAGAVVAAAGRAAAPVRSGALAASLRPAKAVGGVTVRAGGARVPYANPIHWGWPGRGIAPSLFLTSAAQATEPQWLDIYWNAVKRAIAQVKGK